MTKFADLGLSSGALNAVEKLGYTDPTPIQKSAIPIVLQGRDVIAAASTGTGKTAAFLLPVLGVLEKSKRARRAPRVLVITPTRELAQQIAYAAFKITRQCGHYATVVYGGTPYNKQIRELREGTDILIATPGRLVDLIDRKVVDLSKIEVLVLDEADRMLDMGFLPDVTKIVDLIPEKRQTLLFSATIDASITNNLGSLLNNPQVIQIARKGQTAEKVAQYILPISNKAKPDLLKALLDEKGHDKVVVFARTKARAEDICSMLNEAGFDSVSIHSDKAQTQRRQALSDFRSGRVGIIVATDVLARGIDVPSVDYVVNYDLPDMSEDYIHRIGRTGRAGEQGFAVSFVSPTSLKVLDAIQALLGREIPIMRLETFDVDPNIIKRTTRTGKKKQSEYSKVRARRHKETKYDYTGYGDLRRGKKKKKDVREEDAKNPQSAKKSQSGRNFQDAKKSQGVKASNAERNVRKSKHVKSETMMTKGERKRTSNVRPGMKSSALRKRRSR